MLVGSGGEAGADGEEGRIDGAAIVVELCGSVFRVRHSHLPAFEIKQVFAVARVDVESYPRRRAIEELCYVAARSRVRVRRARSRDCDL